MPGALRAPPSRAAGRLRTVAFLIGLPVDHPIFVARFKGTKGLLASLGWVEDETIRFVVRSSLSQAEALAANAAETARTQPDIIVAGSSAETAAALSATKTIPVLFSTASDPVGSGFVRSLERPDGNATGFSNNAPELAGKWLELLREIAPGMSQIGVIFNPDTAAAGGRTYLENLRRDAAGFGLATVSLPCQSVAAIEAGIAGLDPGVRTGLILPPDSFTFRNARAIVAAVNARPLPAMYLYESFVEVGGLMSYTGARDETDTVIATYIDLILRGANVAELPVQFSRSFELVLNERTALAQGLTIPQSLRVRASRIVA